jgi:hypothetical protein
VFFASGVGYITKSVGSNTQDLQFLATDAVEKDNGQPVF